MRGPSVGLRDLAAKVGGGALIDDGIRAGYAAFRRWPLGDATLGEVEAKIAKARDERLLRKAQRSKSP